jgi:hypothetical protein
MITVIETKSGAIEPIGGNPTLTSLDGTMRAPLRTIMSPTWTAKERAAFGIYVVAPAAIPAGKQAVGLPQYQKKSGTLVQVRTLEDVRPSEPPPVLTAQEKVERMAAHFDLTLDDIRTVLVGATV